MFIQDQDALFSSYMHEMLQQKQDLILEQLNDLVSRKLLVIEETEMAFVHDPVSNKVRMLQGIRFLLKDQEYIERLEKDNAELKARLDTITQAVKAP